MSSSNVSPRIIVAAVVAVSAIGLGYYILHRQSKKKTHQDAVNAIVNAYPRTRLQGVPLVYAYGTAGFRTSQEVLDSAMARVGILAGLLSAYCGGAAVGVMITASHNPNKDNGVKIMDSHGEMISKDWEDFASM
jgi:uncharacterized membrane protein YfcA